jgi:hypothetical protein
MLGVGLALALATNFGFLLRHRGAVAAAEVGVRHPLRSAIRLFRSKWWTIGDFVAAVACGFHVGALALAPLSLVQAVLAGRLVPLGVIAERWFGSSALLVHPWRRCSHAVAPAIHVGART